LAIFAIFNFGPSFQITYIWLAWPSFKIT
jgi:hypothetical protein